MSRQTKTDRQKYCPAEIGLSALARLLARAAARDSSLATLPDDLDPSRAGLLKPAPRSASKDE